MASKDHRPLEVEVWADGELLTTAKADGYRHDLRQAGLGDGRHAFRCELLASQFTSTREVSVKVRDSDFLLSYKDQTRFRVEPACIVKYLACDVVNNCNLRCPFCLVDYSATSTTELMSEEVLVSLLRLMPLLPAQSFWLSCLHEPTLHPRFCELMDLIPAQYREKVWFTTNLARPLSDDVFQRWATSGLHHINVSLDTMNPDLFKVLRKFGRYAVFKDNLDRMTQVFRREPRAPKLRYITMAFRSNLDEIPDIVAHSHEHWLSAENEIRFTIDVEHISDAFRHEHYLRKEDWTVLSERLKVMPYQHSIVYPPEGKEEIIFPAANYFELLGIEARSSTELAAEIERPLGLRARPDGKVLISGRENLFAVNVMDLDDPVAFFRGL